MFEEGNIQLFSGQIFEELINGWSHDRVTKMANEVIKVAHIGWPHYFKKITVYISKKLREETEKR